ncbi:hypothetical protein H9P43_008034 [Blastocladiella emersonii ATCC 22665]|nr:hypothetical protein H9P43_008034 [Blastocladiella emersonii ATCC 22665]
MQIYLPLHQDRPHDLVLIELQGVLECDGDAFAGQTLGRIGFADDSETESPTLIIGNHRLEGKVVKLKKPLAVIKRAGANSSLFPAAAGGGDVVMSESHGDEGEGDNLNPTAAGEWHIVGLIKAKFEFRRRPQNLV